VNEWLDGTTRYQMSGAQRAFWVDLLAMAGRSRYPGIICSGMDDDQYVGYPLKTFAALDAGAEIDLLGTLDLFSKTRKIVVEITAESPVKLYKFTVCNWDRYQSEYQRQKGYRKSDKRKHSEVTRKVTTDNTPKLPVEGEEEGEGDGERKHGAPETGAPTAQAKQLPSLSVFSGLHLSVSLQQDHALGEAFPWVDRLHEYAKADSWLEANPNRRPRKLKPFLHNWLSKISAPTGGKGGMTRAEQRTLNNLKAAGFVQ